MRCVFMVCKIKVSMTFSAWQRSETGSYEVHWEVFFLDFGIVVLNNYFQIAGF